MDAHAPNDDVATQRLEVLCAKGPAMFGNGREELDSVAEALLRDVEYASTDVLEHRLHAISTATKPPTVCSSAWEEVQQHLLDSINQEYFRRGPARVELGGDLQHRAPSQSTGEDVQHALLPEDVPDVMNCMQLCLLLDKVHTTSPRVEVSKLMEQPVRGATLTKVFCSDGESLWEAQAPRCLLAEANRRENRPGRKGIKYFVFDLGRSVDDWISNCSCFPPTAVGTFHSGYYRASECLSVHALKAFIDEGYDVVLGGHSRGGAMATCAFHRFLHHHLRTFLNDPACLRVVAFGAPSCGTADVGRRIRAAGYAHAILNVVAEGDPISRVFNLLMDVPSDQSTDAETVLRGLFDIYGSCDVSSSSDTSLMTALSPIGHETLPKHVPLGRVLNLDQTASVQPDCQEACDEHLQLFEIIGRTEDVENRHRIEAYRQLIEPLSIVRHAVNPVATAVEKLGSPTITEISILCQRESVEDPSAAAMYHLEIHGSNLEFCDSVAIQSISWPICNRRQVDGDPGKWVLSGVLEGDQALGDTFKCDHAEDAKEHVSLWTPFSSQAQQDDVPFIFSDDPLRPGDDLSDEDWLVCYVLYVIMRLLAIYKAEGVDTPNGQGALDELLRPITTFLYKGLSADSFFEALSGNENAFLAFAMVGAAKSYHEQDENSTGLNASKISKRSFDALKQFSQVRSATGAGQVVGQGGVAASLALGGKAARFERQAAQATLAANAHAASARATADAVNAAHSHWMHTLNAVETYRKRFRVHRYHRAAFSPAQQKAAEARFVELTRALEGFTNSAATAQGTAASASASADAFGAMASKASFVGLAVSACFIAYRVYNEFGELAIDSLPPLSPLHRHDAETRNPGLRELDDLAEEGYTHIISLVDSIGKGEVEIEVDGDGATLEEFLNISFTPGGETDWLGQHLQSMTRHLYELDVALRNRELPPEERQSLNEELRGVLPKILRVVSEIAALASCFLQEGRETHLDMQRGTVGKTVFGTLAVLDSLEAGAAFGIQYTLGLFGCAMENLGFDAGAMKRQCRGAFYALAKQKNDVSNDGMAISHDDRLRLFVDAFPGLRARELANNGRTMLAEIVRSFEDFGVVHDLSLREIRDQIWPDGKAAPWLKEGCNLGRVAEHDRLRVSAWLKSFFAVDQIISRVNSATVSLLIGPAGAGKSTLVANLISDPESIVHGEGVTARSQFPQFYPVRISPAREVQIADVPGFLEDDEAEAGAEPIGLIDRIAQLASSVVVVVNFQAIENAIVQTRDAILKLVRRRQLRQQQILVCVTHIEQLYEEKEDEVIQSFHREHQRVPTFDEYKDDLRHALDVERANIVGRLCGDRQRDILPDEVNLLRSVLALANTKFMISTFALSTLRRRPVLGVLLPDEENARRIGIVTAEDVRLFLFDAIPA